MSMTDILIKAASFTCIILAGYLLRRKGFFKEEDFYVLSKIVLKITLPAAIVANFSTMEFEVSMLSICLFGLSGGVILIGVIWLINTGKPNERKGFDVLNVAGYNIGNFTMPFIQGFLGTTGLAAASLFDTGNSIICLGGACSMAMAAMRTGQKQTIRDLVRPLLKSVPFIAYITMTILTLMNIRLPRICMSFAQTVGGANAFLALLMVGIGFKLSLEPDKIATIFRCCQCVMEFPLCWQSYFICLHRLNWKSVRHLPFWYFLLLRRQRRLIPENWDWMWDFPV